MQTGTVWSLLWHCLGDRWAIWGWLSSSLRFLMHGRLRFQIRIHSQSKTQSLGWTTFRRRLGGHPGRPIKRCKRGSSMPLYHPWSKGPCSEPSKTPLLFLQLRISRLSKTSHRRANFSKQVGSKVKGPLASLGSRYTRTKLNSCRLRYKRRKRRKSNKRVLT